ncbi:Methyltransferase-like protein 13 [Chlorella vulgaris]
MSASGVVSCQCTACNNGSRWRLNKHSSPLDVNLRPIQRQQQQWQQQARSRRTCTPAAASEGLPPDALAAEFQAFVLQQGVDGAVPPSRPTHLMSPLVCISAQMRALQRNDYPEPDAGVRTCFMFAKPEECEELVTAPVAPQRVRSWAAHEEWLAFADFSNQLRSPPFLPLLNCDSWQPASQLVFPSSRHKNKAVFAIELGVGEQQQRRQLYTFCLEKIEQGPFKNCWVTRRRGDLSGRLPIGSGTQAEGPLQELAELFGATGGDPGHWNLSPEWWGNQGGGWGKDAGVTVYESHSELGNGRITVTSHSATPQSSPGAAESAWEEWRVLRFNGVTRQSVARVRVQPTAARGSIVTVLPDCLAQDYLKSTAAVTAALLGLLSLLPRAAAASGAAMCLRVLCIGVGGGSLPLFLAHHFPGAVIDAVELDPAVVAAATSAMGLREQPTLRLHTADAAAFLAQRRRRQQGQQQQVGQQQRGGQQQRRGQQQLGGLQKQDQQLLPGQQQVALHQTGHLHPQAEHSLHQSQLRLQHHHQQHQSQQHQQHWQHRQQQHGHAEHPLEQGQATPPLYDLVIMDAFDGADNVPATLCTPEFAELVASALHPQHGCFLLNMHSIVDQDTIAGFKLALLGSNSHTGSTGSFFAVRSRKQPNQCIVGARGLQLPAGGEAHALRRAATEVAAAAGFRFPAGSRACNGYQPL